MSSYHPYIVLGVCSSYAWVSTRLDDICVKLNAWCRNHHMLSITNLRSPTLAGTRQTGVIHWEESIPSGIARWKSRERWTRWAASSWLRQQTHPVLKIQWIITAWFVGRKRPFRYMECMRSFDTSRAPSTFREVNVFIWKLQVGGCLIKKAIQGERKNLGGSGSWGLHKWWETETIVFQMISWWTFRLQLTSVFLYSQRFQFWSRHLVWVRATNLSTSSSPTSL